MHEQLVKTSKTFVAGLIILVSIVIGTLLESAESDHDQTATKSSKSFDVVFKEFKLNNGLRVILSEDHSAPTYSISVTYNVGSRDEKPGRTGFAHLFEHMMFEGSQNVGKTEHFKYVQEAGGTCNASTHNDFTNYFDRLPSNQVNLGLWLEADRMRSLNVTPENFKNQLETVKEEKRLRLDNQPYQAANLKLDEMV